MMCSGYDPRAVVLEQVPDFQGIDVIALTFPRCDREDAAPVREVQCCRAGKLFTMTLSLDRLNTLHCDSHSVLKLLVRASQV